MSDRVKYELAFELAGLPRMTNPSGRAQHWTARMKEAQKWKSAVWAVVSVKGRPEKPLEKAKLVLTRYSSVSPDSDGLVSGFKHVVDGLVHAKVLENDKVSNIGMPEFRWVKTSPRKGRIRVEVYEE